MFTCTVIESSTRGRPRLTEQLEECASQLHELAKHLRAAPEESVVYTKGRDSTP